MLQIVTKQMSIIMGYTYRKKETMDVGYRQEKKFGKVAINQMHSHHLVLWHLHRLFLNLFFIEGHLFRISKEQLFRMSVIANIAVWYATVFNVVSNHIGLETFWRAYG